MNHSINVTYLYKKVFFCFAVALIYQCWTIQSKVAGLPLCRHNGVCLVCEVNLCTKTLCKCVKLHFVVVDVYLLCITMIPFVKYSSQIQKRSNRSWLRPADSREIKNNLNKSDLRMWECPNNPRNTNCRVCWRMRESKCVFIRREPRSNFFLLPCKLK